MKLLSMRRNMKKETEKEKLLVQCDSASHLQYNKPGTGQDY